MMSSTNTEMNITQVTSFYTEKIQKQYEKISLLESQIRDKDKQIENLEKIKTDLADTIDAYVKITNESKNKSKQ